MFYYENRKETGITAIRRERQSLISACIYGLMKLALRAFEREKPFAIIGRSRTPVSPSRMPSAFELSSCHYARCLTRSDRRADINEKPDAGRHTHDSLLVSESEVSMQK